MLYFKINIGITVIVILQYCSKKLLGLLRFFKQLLNAQQPCSDNNRDFLSHKMISSVIMASLNS